MFHGMIRPGPGPAKISKKTAIAIIGAALMLANGCSSNSNATVSANLKIAKAVGAMMNMSITPLDVVRSWATGEHSLAVGDFGTAAASDIQSLKYMVYAVSVCESMTTTGTAFSSPQGCISIYDSGIGGGPGSGTWNYDPNNQNYTVMGANALANSTASTMIDLVDPNSVGKLTQNVSVGTDGAHAYSWGFLNWYPAAIVRGQVSMGGGEVIHTKSTGSYNVSGQFVVTDDMTTGSAEDTAISTGNGGTWFRFQNPLVITADDITNKTQFAVDLAFNPDGYLKGLNNIAGCGTCGINTGPTGKGLATPELDITPIPHKAGDTVKRETYIANVSGAQDTYSIRVQLYYLDSDSTKTIYGVNTTTLLSPTAATNYVYDFPKISFVASNTDNSLNFQTWNQTKVLDGFTRQSTVGGTTTATVNCTDLGGGGFATVDCAAGSSFSATFTLTEVGDL